MFPYCIKDAQLSDLLHGIYYFATDQTFKINLFFNSEIKKEGADYDILLHQRQCKIKVFMLLRGSVTCIPVDQWSALISFTGFS